MVKSVVPPVRTREFIQPFVRVVWIEVMSAGTELNGLGNENVLPVQAQEPSPALELHAAVPEHAPQQ